MSTTRPAGQQAPVWPRSQALAQPPPGLPTGLWAPDEFMAERVERGRRLLAESEEHRGDADLQNFMGQMDATWALNRLLLDAAGRPRTALSSREQLQAGEGAPAQAMALFLTASMHNLQTELWHRYFDPRVLWLLPRLLKAAQVASVEADALGIQLLAAVGQVAAAEVGAHYTDLPRPKQEMVDEALEVLDTLCSDQCWVAEAAADAERHQQSAGLASRLSTADLQRLCLLLHLRCASMAACSARQVSGQQARAQELQLAALADVDKLVSLQGGGPAPLMYLHWRGVIQNERRLHTQSVASLEAALAACQATPASLMEASAAMLLASQLKLTGAGGRWSAAHAHELLARAQRALARCKPWLPKPVTRKFQLMAYAIEAEPSPVVKKCAACKAVAYCSVACQKQHWRAGHKQECARLAAGASGSGSRP